jgi:hypothetical protein
MGSFENVGATNRHGVVIRTAGDRDFAACAQYPFTTRPEAASDLELKRRAEVAVALQSPSFFKFGIGVPMVGQRDIDRRFQMNLLLFRDPALSNERLIKLNERLELECAGGLQDKRDNGR